MNQAQLIEAISQQSMRHYDAGVSKTVVEAVLRSQADVATKALKQGDDVTLPGLGKLSINKKAARKGRNPSTGAEITIPAKNVPKFTAAKALKDAVA